MVTELPGDGYGRVGRLFAELDYHLSIAAVLAGTMPGHVFVDDQASPRAALITSTEGCYLACDGPPSAAVDFGRAAVEQVLARWPEIGLFAAPAWEPHSAALCAGRRHELLPRRRYALRALAGDWQLRLPAGLALARLDAAIFARAALAEHHIQSWARANWGSVENFLARGFGFVIFDGARAASWCLADSAAGERCEIGIHTHPDYRRRGLATAVVAATAAHALAQGYAELGWHCGEENVGSQGVAEKAGFKLTHRFNLLYCKAEV